MSNISHYSPITSLLETIVDNRGKTVPVSDCGFPLIATNCIKHSSLYPTPEKLRYISDEVKSSWFRAHPKPNDILFVNKGSPGRVCLVPKPVPFCIAQDMVAFRCNSELIDYRYLFAVLRSDFIQKTIENFHVGLVIPHFKKGDLDNILIPRKENKSQEDAIGSLYISLCEKIELNNKVNSELEAMAKLIYDFWFVQFDFPDENGEPYKSSGGKMVYNESLKREIPAGWEVFQLSSILKSNYSSLGRDVSFDEIEYLDTSSLTKNVIESTESINTDQDKVPSRAKRIIQRNDILYSTVRPNLCHYGIIKHPLKNMIGSTGFVQLSSKVDWISNDLIYTFLTSSWITDRLQQIAALAVSAYPSISPNDILGFHLCLPNEGELIKDISKKLDNIYSKISVNQKENKKLSELRDWLLPMLMNGQVTVA